MSQVPSTVMLLLGIRMVLDMLGFSKMDTFTEKAYSRWVLLRVSQPM